ESAFLGCAEPLPERCPVADTELADCVCDVVFDRIDADSPTFGNVSVRHAMLHGMHYAPFRRRQHVIIGRSASTGPGSHAEIVILGALIFPPPAPDSPHSCHWSES